MNFYIFLRPISKFYDIYYLSTEIFWVFSCNTSMRILRIFLQLIEEFYEFLKWSIDKFRNFLNPRYLFSTNWWILYVFFLMINWNNFFFFAFLEQINKFWDLFNKTLINFTFFTCDHSMNFRIFSFYELVNFVPFPCDQLAKIGCVFHDFSYQFTDNLCSFYLQPIGNFHDNFLNPMENFGGFYLQAIGENHGFFIQLFHIQPPPPPLFFLQLAVEFFFNWRILYFKHNRPINCARFFPINQWIFLSELFKNSTLYFQWWMINEFHWKWKFKMFSREARRFVTYITLLSILCFEV